ncbi:MAG: hypothetical protein BGO51_06480 [Rhodospirillales bacterium 69-11]|nr:hypothetical protein [Rhodospirillales bacterium]MBN8929915.1 hypothetical protein [Rhodospirillales bacterium]OJW23955.1 MAG: hypothetical protein BGO51_06480 [Rhodospirillales bacterium 69-11]
MADERPTLSALRNHLMSDAELGRYHDQQRNRQMLAEHDTARAAAPRVLLVATTAFTLVDDENPDGRVVNMGEEFEVSEFDLPRYIGRGLRPAGDVAGKAGPSVTVG